MSGPGLPAELVRASLAIQTACAAADSLGLGIFGRSVTNARADPAYA